MIGSDLLPRPALLFIRTRESDTSTEYLLTALEKYTDLIYEANANNLVEAVDSFRKALPGGFFQNYSRLIVASDQLLGPLSDLMELFEALKDNSSDAISITSLTQLAQWDEPTSEIPFLSLRTDLLADAHLWTEIESDQTFTRFTRRVAKLGHSVSSLYKSPSEQKDAFARSFSSYESLKNLPFLPWSLFTSDPLLLERWAISARPAYEVVCASTYPLSTFWDRLLFAVPPQTWYTNLGLLNIFSPTEKQQHEANELHTAVVLHVFYPQLLEELWKYAQNVPQPASLFITTDTREKREAILKFIDKQNHFESMEVRVVETNNGRDISALLLDCADVLTNPKFDLVIKLHSKKSAQDPESVSQWFKSHLFENLLSTPDYAQRIFSLFAKEPRLGTVFPPIIHMGLPTMGNGWTLNKEPARVLAKKLGIRIPFDKTTPLSPFGSMFIARREALEPLAKAGFTAQDFPDAAGYKDGSFAHVIERLFSYVVFNQGFYARCVQTTSLAEISAVNLEYKLDAISAYSHPHAINQIELFDGEKSGNRWRTLRSQTARQLNSSFPKVGKAAMSAWNLAKKVTGINKYGTAGESKVLRN